MLYYDVILCLKSFDSKSAVISISFHWSALKNWILCAWCRQFCWTKSYLHVIQNVYLLRKSFVYDVLPPNICNLKCLVPKSIYNIISNNILVNEIRIFELTREIIKTVSPIFVLYSIRYILNLRSNPGWCSFPIE